MSDWRLKTGKQGSFRGVKFYVTDAQHSAGRESAVHKYPKTKKPPFVEDMGAAGEEFTVNCYVNGDEYEADRKALVKALNTEGPGELFHPYYFDGPKRVMVVGKFSVGQSGDDSGKATFSINFAETSLEQNPLATISGGDAVRLKGVTAMSSIRARFLAAFKPLANLTDSVTGAMTKAGDAVGSVVDIVALPAQASASLRNKIATLSDEAESLASAPEDLTDSFFDLIDTLAEGLILVDNISPHSFLQKLAGYDAGTRPPSTTDQRLEEQSNYDQTKALFQRAALVKSAILLADETFDSFDEAVTAREALIDDFETHLENSDEDDSAFVALIDLRTALVNAVPGEGSDLPRLLNYTPTIGTNTLVLAHSLYGNLDKELDLAKRNHVRHPGFVLPDVELEVLSN